ncbi:MAG: hypothetical protein HKN58_03855 [Xanthomonadales bacterium]|nr:hypothetical protein [Xanthomonadales bacterium]
MNYKLRTCLAACAVATLGIMSTAHAASNPDLNITATEVDSTCATSEFLVTSEWQEDVDDAFNCDIAAVIVYDGLGVPIASDWQCTQVGNYTQRDTPFGDFVGSGAFMNIINEITARPLTAELYDVDFEPAGGRNFLSQYEEIINAGAPLMLSQTWDPAEQVPGCGSLPLIGGAATPVPSTTFWGMLLLSGLLLTIGLVRARQRT